MGKRHLTPLPLQQLLPQPTLRKCVLLAGNWSPQRLHVVLPGHWKGTSLVSLAPRRPSTVGWVSEKGDGKCCVLGKKCYRSILQFLRAHFCEFSHLKHHCLEINSLQIQRPSYPQQTVNFFLFFTSVSECLYCQGFLLKTPGNSSVCEVQ